MKLEIRPSGQACGASVVGVDLTQEQSNQTVAAIREAWLEHHVLSFPDQAMNLDDLERFTRAIGSFGHDPFVQPLADHPHIIALHRAAQETASIFAESWHSDWSFQDTPPAATCLFGKVVPPVGGETHFADQHKALASLPEALKTRIKDLHAVHSARNGYGKEGMYGENQSDVARATKIVISEDPYRTVSHPLIRQHPETGEAALYGTVGYVCGIVGMANDEAIDLLKEVYRWQTDRAMQYRHQWQPDMLVLWDNRSVLHRATGGYDGHERLMYRTTIAGSAVTAP